MSHLHLIAIASPTSAPGHPAPPSLNDSVRAMTSPAQSSIAQSSIVSLQPSKNSSSTTTAKAATSVRYDSFFNNPKADAVVLSSDHVVFRCYAWDLQRACPLLKLDQLPQTAKGVKKLELTAMSSIVSTFLGLATSHPALPPSADALQLSFEHLSSLLDLSARYGFEKGVRACLDSMGYQAKEDPWKVFEIASKRDDVQLARMALSAMEHGGGEKVRDFANLRYEDFKDIAPAYTFELLRLLHIHKSTPILTDPFTAAIIASASPGRPRAQFPPSSPVKPMPTPTRSTTTRKTMQTTPTRRPRLLRAPPSSMLPERQIVPRRVQGEVDWNQLAEDFDPWRK